MANTKTNTNVEIKEMTVFGREVTHNGNTWCNYSFTKDGQKFYDVVFTSEKKPTSKGYWKITVPKSAISVKRKKNFNDIIFINEVIDYNKDVEKEKAYEEQCIKDVEELFD